MTISRIIFAIASFVWLMGLIYEVTFKHEEHVSECILFAALWIGVAIRDLKE